MPGNKKSKSRLVKVLGILVALAAAVIAVPFFLDANQFRPELESRLTSALGRQVKVGNLRLSLLSGGVSADDITIADEPRLNKGPFVSAKSLRVSVQLRPLIFSRTIRVTGIALDGPEITLIRTASGDWNFSSLGGKSDPGRVRDEGTNPAPSSVPDITISDLKITNGRVTMIRGSGKLKPYVYDKVNITARDLSYTSVFPFTVNAGLPGGGSLNLEGKAGPVNSGDVSATPFDATVAIKRFDLIASGFVEPESGLAGRIDFSCSLASDGKKLQGKGTARADGLQFVKTGSPAGRPVALTFELSQDLRNQSGALHDAKVEIGGAVAHLTGTYDSRGDRDVVKMRLRGENMPVQDLEAILPAAGVTLPRGASLEGGVLNADLSTEGPIDKMVTTGTVELAKTRLAGFDLGSKMMAVASLAGIQPSSVTEIEKFSSGMRMTPEGIQISDLSLIVPALGELSGAGNIGEGNSLDFNMRARLTTSGNVVGGLARLAGLPSGNALNVPFFIRGTTTDPRFVPDVKGVAGSLLDSAGKKTTSSGQPSPSQNLGDILKGLLDKKKK